MSFSKFNIQDLVYTLEHGVGRLWVRWTLAVLIGSIVTGLYLFTEAKNFSNPEAMERAQLARNIASGKGYTTQMIRPLSIRLLQDHAIAQGEGRMHPLNDPHPDLQNPPVHPLLLAALFKCVPNSWTTQLPADPTANRPLIEHIITVFHLGWFALAVYLTYRIGRQWFRRGIAIFAAAALAGTELFWRMASNGLDSSILLVVFLLIAYLLAQLDQWSQKSPSTPPPPKEILKRTVALGALLGIACLTRYSLGWLLLPLYLFLLWMSPRPKLAAISAALTFFLIVTPWLARNYHLSGHFFGTAGFAMDSLTITFPGDQVQRTLQTPDSTPNFTQYRVKLAEQSAGLLRDSLSNPAGNWLWFFFLVGLLVPIRLRHLSRIRWFIIACCSLLFFVQALGTTHLSANPSGVHSENLLCLLAPLYALFGTAFLFQLLDSTLLGHVLFRNTFLGTLWLVLSLPLLTVVLPPRSYPLVQPVYRPDIIQVLTSYIEPDEMMMSDIPWAVAWYGNRSCIWLSLRVQSDDREDLFAVHDFIRPINALYLSPYTTEVPVRNMVIDLENHRWAWTYLDALVRRNLPRGFPLTISYQGSARAGHLFLADRQRW